jgi:hypothetical protein
MDPQIVVSSTGLAIIFTWIYFSIAKNRRKTFYLAAKKFRIAFTDGIHDLSQGKGDAFEILRRSSREQEKAYIQFRAFLQGKALRRFDEAWREYHGYGGENPHPFLEQYSAAGNVGLAKEKRSLALRRIQNLFSFAKIR